jgi:ligand-binding sensor domain-containing protein/two-component sensor histidine kinase
MNIEMNRILRLSGIADLFALLIFTQIAFAQPHPRFQHLSDEQGLSANIIRSITQDKNGLMWLGTNDGINRFDGYSVEIFRHEAGDINSLPDNALFCLFTDSRGIVWIGSGNGLARYDDHANSFHLISLYPKNDKSHPNGNIINAISEDSHGLIWIGTGEGLCSFDVKTNRFQRFVHNDRSGSISDDHIRDIKLGPDGVLWIATIHGLNKLDPVTMRFTSFFHDIADSSTISTSLVRDIAFDKDGNLWTGSISDDKLYLDCFNTRTYHCKHFTKYVPEHSSASNLLSVIFPQNPGNMVTSLNFDRNGRLWIGSSMSGLSLFLPDTKIFYDYAKNPIDPDGLRSNNIISIYEDQSGMIWIGTLAGAERFNPNESKFILYRSQLMDSVATDQKTVQAFAEDNFHRLWIGTSNGLFILDRNTGKFTQFIWSKNKPESVNENSITAICRDRQGSMWIGTLNGLKFFDPAKNVLRSYYAEGNDSSLANNNISSIVCDKNGDLLIAGRPGFSIYKSQMHQFVNYNKGAPGGLLNKRNNNIVFEDSHGRIWLGTQARGLIQYDIKNGKIENFTRQGNEISSLAATYVSSIAQDHKGIIWIGTRSGLSRFNENTRTFTNFTAKAGLPDVRIKQLLIDDKDRIWMSSNRGISMLDESRASFTNYDPSDGLQGWEFSEPSAFQTHDGYFCYGGTNGFNMFHPDSIKKNPFIPPVIVRRITIFDQPLNLDSSNSVMNSLKLSYDQNFFSFVFAALNFDHPEKNKFACQLIGFDKKMVQLGTSHSISYTNVPPANYTLKVMASNNDGVWNEVGYKLKLTIVPPFWATWWFRAIVIFLLLFAVFLYFKLRENRIKKEQARQTAINKRIAELRMSALQAQMNPHFIFNSLSSIQHLISIREKEEAISYLSKFSKLVRQILENSRENTVSIKSELELLELYIQLEQLRFNHRFEYHLVIDKKIDMENTEIPPLLIQPYIENAIVHGLVNKEGKGDLWFSMERNNGSVVCKIEDNGIGRARAQEIKQKKDLKHKSLGITVTNERIATLTALMEYKTEVLIEDLFEPNQGPEEKAQPRGTRVTIRIPVKEEE